MHGARNCRHHPFVEKVWDNFLRRRMLYERRESASGAELSLFSYLFDTFIQNPTEKTGENERVINLIGIIRTTCRNHNCASFSRLFGQNFRLKIY